MLIITFRVFMRLKLNEIMHVKCLVEYLEFIKCSINASGSNVNIQVPICLKKLCLWVSAHVTSVVTISGCEEKFIPILAFTSRYM